MYSKLSLKSLLSKSYYCQRNVICNFTSETDESWHEETQEFQLDRKQKPLLPHFFAAMNTSCLADEQHRSQSVVVKLSACSCLA